MQKVLSLFSGYGGLCHLALDHAGLSPFYSVEQFVEINPYCQAILHKHLPEVPIHDDIRTFNANEGEFQIICGGSPYQGNSNATNGDGLTDERSCLWWEQLRIISQCRPTFTIWENVSGARHPKIGNNISPLGEVLWSLDAIGYSALWFSIRACDVGAPHERDRVFVIASHTDGFKQEIGSIQKSWAGQIRGAVADTLLHSRVRQATQEVIARGARISSSHPRVSIRTPDWLYGYHRKGWWEQLFQGKVSAPARSIPKRRQRMEALGNGVVPQQAAVAWLVLDSFSTKNEQSSGTIVLP